jgi:hypothetical protein
MGVGSSYPKASNVASKDASNPSAAKPGENPVAAGADGSCVLSCFVDKQCYLSVYVLWNLKVRELAVNKKDDWTVPGYSSGSTIGPAHSPLANDTS